MAVSFLSIQHHLPSQFPGNAGTFHREKQLPLFYLELVFG
jgi:hypothetical protein